jgi:hypothetical protein
MKRTLRFLMVAFAALIVNFAYAQLPDGSICPDWTGTDINGNTWNLYDVLDEGKQVVIDVSATWCAPCWNYHQTGALDELMEEHGPDGTDDLMVFWIEGDAETTLADIQGTGGNTQGDWTEGTTFPIIDDASIGDLLAVNAFPTIYLVCPNRVITEVGQANAATIWNAASAATCQAATQAVDPAMIDVATSGDACQGVFSADVDFMNLGTSNLTSATITANGCTNCPLSTNWTGDIETYGTASAAITGIEVSGDQNITFDVTANGDGDVNNNAASTFLYASDHTTHFQINGLTDNWPGEASWELRDGNGNVVQTGGNYPDDGNGTPVEIFHDFAVDGDLGCWEFTWIDSYGDGMHGTQWGGIDGFVGVESIDTDGNKTFYYYDGSYDFDTDSGNGNVSVVSVDEAVAFEASMSVYPNPSTGASTLDFVVASSTEVSYQVVDMLGKVVANDALGTLPAGEQRVALDLNNLEAGVYMINVTAGSNVASTRITIAK